MGVSPYLRLIYGPNTGQNFLWGSKGGSAPLKEKTAHMESTQHDPGLRADPLAGLLIEVGDRVQVAHCIDPLGTLCRLHRVPQPLHFPFVTRPGPQPPPHRRIKHEETKLIRTRLRRVIVESSRVKFPSPIRVERFVVEFCGHGHGALRRHHPFHIRRRRLKRSIKRNRFVARVSAHVSSNLEPYQHYQKPRIFNFIRGDPLNPP